MMIDRFFAYINPFGLFGLTKLLFFFLCPLISEWLIEISIQSKFMFERKMLCAFNPNICNFAKNYAINDDVLWHSTDVRYCNQINEKKKKMKPHTRDRYLCFKKSLQAFGYNFVEIYRFEVLNENGRDIIRLKGIYGQLIIILCLYVYVLLLAVRALMLITLSSCEMNANIGVIVVLMTGT